MAMAAQIGNFFGIRQDNKADIRKRMNLLGIAEAHIIWKTRLWRHIEGQSREALSAEMVGQSGGCHLSNLITSSELAHLHGVEEFELLKEAHHQFHELGAQILELLKAGDSGGASAIFKDQYSASLRDIIQALTWLNRHLTRD